MRNYLENNKLNLKFDNLPEGKELSRMSSNKKETESNKEGIREGEEDAAVFVVDSSSKQKMAIGVGDGDGIAADGYKMEQESQKEEAQMRKRAKDWIN